MEKQQQSHSFEVLNRTSCSMTGIQKVISSSENGLSLISSCGAMEVVGKKLKIDNFSVDDGTLSFEGEIDCIKYSAKKTPLIKRLFK